MKKFILAFAAAASFAICGSVVASPATTDDFFGAPVFHIGGRDGVTEFCRYTKATKDLYVRCVTYEGNRMKESSISRVDMNCKDRTYVLDGKKDSVPREYSSATAFPVSLFEAICQNKHTRPLESGSPSHGNSHVGKWGMMGLKGSCKKGSDASLIITKDRFAQYEDVCKVKSWKTKDNHFTFTGSCDSEGESYKPNYELRMIGDDFLSTLKADGGGDIYVRCGT